MSEREAAEPQKGFKFIDRRRFTDEGDERESPDIPPEPVRAPAPAAKEPAQKAAPTASAPQAPAGAPAPGDDAEVAGDPNSTEEADAPGALTFSMFVQSLVQQALMQLGMMPWPGPGGQRELHLEAARDTIDILSLLQRKTKGNLRPAEKQLMDTAVYELRMSYVEVTNAIARQGLKGASPPGR